MAEEQEADGACSRRVSTARLSLPTQRELTSSLLALAHSYLILSSLQALDAYLQGDRIFTGRRKLLSKRIETESLSIASPTLPKPTLSANTDSEGKRWIIPPTYTLDIEYARRSNGGKSLLRRVEERVTLGHLGEWFTEEGEFVEELFEKRLVGALQRAWGLDDEDGGVQ